MWRAGDSDWAHANNKMDQQAEKIERLENRIAFLEQKQDPAVVTLMKEAIELEMNPEHWAYNKFTCRGDGYWYGAFPVWVPDRTLHDSVDKFRAEINEVKATKYEECKAKGECGTSTVLIANPVGELSYTGRLVEKKRKRRKKK